MKYLLLFILLILCCYKAEASDSLFIKINKYQFNKADTLNVECDYKYMNPDKANMTLNIIIENIEKTKQWRYRYPLLNGNVMPSIIIDSSINDGRYAINFVVQQDFLKVEGKLRGPQTKSKGLNYLMLAKNKNNYLSVLQPEKNGNFSTPKLLFEDTAQFVFSEVGKQINPLYIDLKTSIDSIFTPIAQQTQFITIGSEKSSIENNNDEPYEFDIIELDPKFTLNEVLITSIKKKKVEVFDERYSSSLFKSGSPTIFDGIESFQIGNAGDVFFFLQGRVAGLNITRDNTGRYNLSWRGGPVDIFLDEMRVDENVVNFINTYDIAMIKAFSPMGGGPSGNGTIAIYSKRGGYLEDMTRKYNFKVNGYTPLISTWK